MSEEKIYISISVELGWLYFLFTIALAFIFAFFKYGFNINAILGTEALALSLLFLSFITGIIPFIGFIVYFLAAAYWLIPEILKLTNLEYNWITTFFIYYNLMTAAIITALTSILTIKLIKG